MWGKGGHGELRGQSCSGSGAMGAQQLRVQGRSEQEEQGCAALGRVRGDVSAGVKVKSGVRRAWAGDGCCG